MPLPHLQAGQSPHPRVLRIRPRLGRANNLLLDLSIGGRLTLGFLTAALIAALVAGLLGALRAQSLSRQSAFYQHLLQANTRLTTGVNYLQLMNSEAQNILEVAAAPTISQETLKTDQIALQNLLSRYDTLLSQYLTSDLLDKHPEQVALLAETNHGSQVTQQRTLVGSASRTWQIYKASQTQFIQEMTSGNLEEARRLQRVQGEPTNADTLSALRALIQFNQRLAGYVSDAAAIEEQNQFLATIGGSVLAFLIILLVGWLISRTLVNRLKQLRRVVRAVEQGQVDARVTVRGRDEIAEVAAAVNAMLETILGLLEQAQQQRDALTRAADHLFSDIRGVGAGDLRINAAVRDDPLNLLANTFNFTVGRFRRFVLRTQHVVEQMDVIARQEIERAENFGHTLTNLVPDTAGVSLVVVSMQKELIQLESLLVPLIVEFRNSQPRNQQEELDITIGKLASSFRTLKVKVNALSSATQPGKEYAGDQIRQSQDYIKEVTTATHQLSKLVHEMRQNLVIYQLDAGESGTGNAIRRPPANYKLADDGVSISPLDSPRRRSAMSGQASIPG